MICAALVLAGCAASQPPTALLTRTEEAIARAEESGAKEDAPLELRSAQKKREDAPIALKEKDMDKAQRLVEEALIDAEVAEVAARSSKAQKAVAQIRASIEAMRQEMAGQNN
jgi:hypothetical protein